MDSRKVLDYLMRRYDMSNGTTYIDGVEVNITTLTELPDILIYIIDDYKSIILVKKTGIDNIYGYCIRCFGGGYYNTVGVHTVSKYNRDYFTSWSSAMGRYLSETHGSNFPSNHSVLYRLAKIMDSHMNLPLDEGELISRFESTNMVKRATS